MLWVFVPLHHQNEKRPLALKFHFMRTIVFGQWEFGIQVRFQKGFFFNDFQQWSINGFLIFFTLVSNDGFLHTRRIRFYWKLVVLTPWFQAHFLLFTFRVHRAEISLCSTNEQKKNSQKRGNWMISQVIPSTFVFFLSWFNSSFYVTI